MADEVVYILTADNELDDGYENIAVAKTVDELVERLNELLEEGFKLNVLTEIQSEALKKNNSTKIIDEFGIKYTLDIEKWYL